MFIILKHWNSQKAKKLHSNSHQPEMTITVLTIAIIPHMSDTDHREIQEAERQLYIDK